jgi:hypothetical protein
VIIGPDCQIIREKEGDDTGNKYSDDKGFCNIRQ